MWNSWLQKWFSTASGRNFTEDQLWASCVEEWDAIEQEKIDSLVKTMPEGIETVIQTKGEHTKW